MSNKVPAGHVSIIRRVVQTAARLNLKSFIVGAQARDLILQYCYRISVLRATTDFDFAFAAETWSEFIALRDLLVAENEFRRDARKEHRLVDKQDQASVDLIPFGPETDAIGPGVMVSAMVRYNSNYNGDFDMAQSRLVELYRGVTETLNGHLRNH
ncbi:MAG TPA: hypothetical protein VFZ22_04740 [Pyrinomonadaceae bacterium]|nr:hypothetical protein [Pyrinomonadaceae bacterium]